jgi:hypothetical protein
LHGALHFERAITGQKDQGGMRRSKLNFSGVALAPVMGLSHPAAAASMYGPDAGKEILPGVQVDTGEWPINIATYKTVVVTDYVFAPGSGIPDEAMKNDMICQIRRARSGSSRATRHLCLRQRLVRGGQEPEQRSGGHARHRPDAHPNRHDAGTSGRKITPAGARVI